MGGGEKEQRVMRVEASGKSTDGDSVEDTITYESKWNGHGRRKCEQRSERGEQLKTCVVN